MDERRRFVIQQHDATRLHWDLRLEHDGVLRSWALPRGVPWNPAENRLAVATEDHSLDFLDIDEERGRDDADPGYGRGRLTNWDRGTYEIHKWEDEKVVITLEGRRATGKYALFSMRGSRDWLIHRMDPPIDADRQPVPTGPEPMTATATTRDEIEALVAEPDGWAFESAWPGLRVIVTVDHGRVTIDGHPTGGPRGGDASPGRDDLTMRFPEIRRIGRAIGHRELILDGTIVPVASSHDPFGGDDGRGPDLDDLRSDRSGLARRLRIRSDSGARNAAAGTAPTVLLTSDLLWADGRSVTDLPWELRRRQLDDLRLDGPAWIAAPLLTPDDAAFALDDATSLVAKRTDSPYRPGEQTPDWLTADALDT
ncbi:MAG: DNA polymerase ligase N-terminal domain-containing protein [Actinomycetota bacterium]